MECRVECVSVSTRTAVLDVLKASFVVLLFLQEARSYPHSGDRSTVSAYGVPSRESTPESRTVGGTAETELSGAELRSRDEMVQLVQRAFENGELLNYDQWAEVNGHAPNRAVQRDTAKHQDTHTAVVSSKPDSPQPRGQHHRQAGTKGGGSVQSDGRIVFPTEGILNLSQEISPDTVPVCRDSTFCESAAAYPEDLVNVAIQRNDSLKYLAGVDVMSDIEQRIDVADDVALCVSMEQVVYPKSAENKRKEWLYVVNQENFKQGVRIETCSRENTDCNIVSGAAEGYKMTCKQKYIYRQLAAVASDGTVAPEMFRFPSSCCCSAKFVGNPLTRMGISLGEQKSFTTARAARRRK